MFGHAPDALSTALAKLTSLHSGDIGVVEVVACGQDAVPALERILLTRERSGIFQIRCHAVEALCGLGAYAVLRHFLNSRRPLADAVEQAGEDAVISEAARSIGALEDRRDLPLLLNLARARALPGVIEGLGRLHASEAAPLFVAALADDFARPAATDALLGLGQAAVSSLLAGAQAAELTAGYESPSSLIRRRNALALLTQLDDGQTPLPAGFAALLDDRDACIAVRASRLYLNRTSATLTAAHLRRLFTALADCDGPLANEIEDLLAAAYDREPVCIDDLIAHTPAPSIEDLLHVRRHSAQVAAHLRDRLATASQPLRR